MDIMKLNILFNDIGDISIGSTRVHVINLSKYLINVGAKIKVNDWDNYDKYDVVIFGKNVGCLEILKAKNCNRNLIIASINPSDFSEKQKKKTDLVDFFIVGCIEERDYYLKYQKPIIIFPPIERFDQKPKLHKQESKIHIGYHGNKMHIEGMSNGLVSALQRLGREYDILLNLLYDVKSTGLAKVPIDIQVNHIQWEYDSFANQIQTFDIGIVPSLTKMPNFIVSALQSFPSSSGFKNDYVFRMKNTSNAGRAFVFFQLGIPVVADMVTSHFHILGNPNNGYIAYSEAGWYDGLFTLANSCECRNYISKNARKEFERLYNPRDWAEMFMAKLELIFDNRK